MAKQHKKNSPLYCSTTAQFHSTCKHLLFNDDNRKTTGHFGTFSKTVLDNDKITPGTFNKTTLFEAF